MTGSRRPTSPISALLIALVVSAGLLGWGTATTSAATASSGSQGACDVRPHGKTILISLADQHLTACQEGGVFVDAPVTTGRAALRTPPGAYSIVRKNSPWTMRSPWPPSSPYWYLPSRVDYTLWFRTDGYAIHDAPWRTRYGPGTQYEGTHGCVNVPRPAMDQLYAWAPVGTPVLVR